MHSSTGTISVELVSNAWVAALLQEFKAKSAHMFEVQKVSGRSSPINSRLLTRMPDRVRTLAGLFQCTAVPAEDRIILNFVDSWTNTIDFLPHSALPSCQIPHTTIGWCQYVSVSNEKENLNLCFSISSTFAIISKQKSLATSLFSTRPRCITTHNAPSPPA